MPYVDFAAIKQQVKIVDVLRWLDIKLKPSGARELRGSCPYCGNGERGFVVNTERNVFNSFCGCGKGSIIDLVSLHHKCGAKEAAQMLQEQFLGKPEQSAPAEHGSSDSTRRRQDDGSPASVPPELKPLDYITSDHEAIEALGLSVFACQALGLGYAPKGTMRGRVVFPLRLPDGTLCGYAGLATNGEMSPLMLIPKNLDQMIAAPITQEKPQQTASDIKNFLRVVK